MIHDDRCQVFQLVNLLLVDGSHFPVEDTQGAEVVAIKRSQWYGSIETQAKLSRNQGISQRPNIDSGVFQDIWIVTEDCGCAKSRTAIDLVYRNPVVRFEPDAIGINDADNGDRHIKSPSRHCGDPVGAHTVRRRVKDIVPAHSCHARSLVEME